MSYKKIKPFLVDSLVCLFVVAITVNSFIYLGYLRIEIDFNLKTVILLIILAIYLLKILNNTIVIGIKGLIDFLLNKSYSVRATYLNIIPLRHSTFSTKITKDRKRFTPTYYWIIAETEEKKIFMVSSEYIEFIKDKEYIFEMGYYSHILLNSKEGNTQGDKGTVLLS